MHTATPVAHEYCPLWQGFVGGHAPVAHATQLPPLQTIPLPQGVPLLTLTTDVQTELPVAHDVVPILQRLPPGLQP